MTKVASPLLISKLEAVSVSGQRNDRLPASGPSECNLLLAVLQPSELVAVCLDWLQQLDRMTDMALAANLLARLSAGAYDDLPMAVEGFRPLALPGTSNGVFHSENAAAEVGIGILGGERVIVLAFRGSDDRVDWINDLRNINTDYAKFNALFSEIESYAASHFLTVVVTGHSLGGALAQVFMSAHPAGGAVSYEAVTFASPGALIPVGADPRITTYNVIDDPVVFLGTNRKEIGDLAESSPLIANALAEQLAANTPLSTGDVLESVPFLTANYVNRGDLVSLNPDGRSPLTLETLLTRGDVAQHAVELYVSLVGTAADPANQSLPAPATAASLSFVETAARGVLREALPGIEVNADALRVDRGLSVTSYTTELVESAQRSTVPAVVIANFIEGVTPNSGRLDSLAAFAKLQYNSYLKTGVQDPGLGPYEALGLGFSSTSAFRAQYEKGTDADYINAAYNAAFKLGPTDAQVTHFIEQDLYFESRYEDAGLSATDAALQARGAVVGQIIGFATAAPSSSLQASATAFLIDASDGQVTYGVPLAGTAASTSDLMAL